MTTRTTFGRILAVTLAVSVSQAFAPVAVTPDELGAAWKDGRVHLTLQTWLNGKLVGDTHAGPEMHFSFFQLLAHVAKTRQFCAGTILGSGTVSNEDRARGISCLAEQRMIETIESGSPKTPFMKHGDRVEIEMFGAYSCRRMYGAKEGKISEHATGNAIDVSGFKLANGKEILVDKQWRANSPESDFLHEVRDRGCTVFQTVLSPDYNAAHHNHLHFDMGAYKVCR